MSRNYDVEKRFFGIYRKTTNKTCFAGNIKLFGIIVYSFNRFGDESNSLTRRWHFKIMTLVHLGPGKSHHRKGWYIFFGRLRINIKFIKPDQGYSIY